jgi:putative DNA primase/helicase
MTINLADLYVDPDEGLIADDGDGDDSLEVFSADLATAVEAKGLKPSGMSADVSTKDDGDDGFFETAQSGSGSSNRIPTVTVNGDIRAMTDSIYSVIDNGNKPPTLFQANGRFRRIGCDDSGTPVMKEHTRHSLADWLVRAEHVVWVKVDKKTGINNQVSPPQDAVLTAMAMADQTSAPVLERVVSTPYFDLNGYLIRDKGYHAPSKTWLEPDDVIIPQVALSPTPGDVKIALRWLLDELLGDFPFKDDSSRATALGLVLLPFVRDLIDGSTPLHLFDASTPGTGKSLCADICTSVGIKGASKTPMPVNDEEMAKALITKWAAGTPLVFFDNVKRRVDSAVLDQAVSERKYSGRILGTNTDGTFNVRNVWVMTTNNASLSRDMVRRAVHCRLDLAVKNVPNEVAEHPELRTGFRHPNITEWAKTNRGNLIWAALTLVQAWVSEGRPAWHGKPLGTFESWSKVIGGVLDTAGVPGFLQNRQEMYQELCDETDAEGEFLEAWWNRYQGATVSLGQLIIVSGTSGDFFAIENLNGQGGNARAGKALNRMKDKVINGYQVTKVGRNWKLTAREA